MSNVRVIFFGAIGAIGLLCLPIPLGFRGCLHKALAGDQVDHDPDRKCTAAEAEAAGLQVVMNRCPKMEYGKLSGEWGWVGGDPGFISSKRQVMHGSGRFQSLGIGQIGSDGKPT